MLQIPADQAQAKDLSNKEILSETSEGDAKSIQSTKEALDKKKKKSNTRKPMSNKPKIQKFVLDKKNPQFIRHFNEISKERLTRKIFTQFLEKRYKKLSVKIVEAV